MAARPGAFGRSRRKTTGGTGVLGQNLGRDGEIITETHKSARVASLRAAERLCNLGLVEKRRGERVAVALTERGADVVDAFSAQLRSGAPIRWGSVGDRPPAGLRLPPSPGARLLSKDLTGVMELIYNAATPSGAADLLGLDYADFDEKEREFLDKAVCRALEEGISWVRHAVADGDQPNDAAWVEFSEDIQGLRRRLGRSLGLLKKASDDQ